MRPVEQVSWEDVTVWCDLIFNNKLIRGVTTANGSDVAVRRIGLPTEAEWEYTCRAGSETEYYIGDGAAALSEAGWFVGNSGNQTHPVGKLAANDFGFYDIHGNVDEWCLDAWDPDAYKKRVDGVENPEVRVADIGEEYPGRVFRGGSWVDSAGDCRLAIRYRRRPGLRIRASVSVWFPVRRRIQSGGTEAQPPTEDAVRRDDERSRKE